MKVLIALPALNEEANISATLQRLPRSLPHARELVCLVVDDGSSDRTAAIASREGATVVSHWRTLGVGQAFHTAVQQALRLGADVLITIDADGQFDPEQIPDVMEPVARGEADFVTGTRFSDRRRPEGMPAAKFWGNRLMTRLLRFFTRTKLSDVSCGFRAYSREALFSINLFGKFTYTQETILDMAFKGLRLAEVPISVRYFRGRKSRVAGSLPRYGFNALKIIVQTARDFKPLRFFGTLGALVFLGGVALDAWLLVHFLRTGSFSPYKFVGFSGLVLNVAGILMFGLALLADMLDRLRVNQERMLYYHRRRFYDGSAPSKPSDERSAELSNGAGREPR
jgi:glycosyltransferase involved in cell wall biosynthesis